MTAPAKARLRPQPAMPMIREIGASYASHQDMNILATLNALQSLAKTLAHPPNAGDRKVQPLTVNQTGDMVSVMTALLLRRLEKR